MKGAPCSSSKVNKFFVDLPCIQKLQMNWSFLKYLAGSALLEKLPKPCLQHLKFLDISICFNVVEDILTARCLLRSAPALEKLEISKFDVPPHQCDNVVALVWMTTAELDFIRFLPLSSPELETMTVHVEPGQLDKDVDECFDLGNKLFRLRLRFEAAVEIIYL
ncbi:hypothetical protein M0R45_011313 [Rubus argutus]|uniref:Uncharacterized protein n=1 Tax=Rubus argutus TaxID=59490 RepID=A0AAW1YAV7_RUBAR